MRANEKKVKLQLRLLQVLNTVWAHRRQVVRESNDVDGFEDVGSTSVPRCSINWSVMMAPECSKQFFSVSCLLAGNVR